jgi:hypothetical protein
VSQAIAQPPSSIPAAMRTRGRCQEQKGAEDRDAADPDGHVGAAAGPVQDRAQRQQRVADVLLSKA